MGEDFNKRELYYQIDDGEVKLLPIKPLSADEIFIEQSKLNLGGVAFPDLDVECSAVIENANDIFTFINSIQQKYDLDRNLYIICEMAKRYLYMLKEKQNNA